MLSSWDALKWRKFQGSRHIVTKLCYTDEWEIICFIAPYCTKYKIGESVKVCVEWLEGESVSEGREEGKENGSVESGQVQQR